MSFFSYFLLVNMSLMSYYFSHLNYAKYFRHGQKIKYCFYLKPFSILICGKFNSKYLAFCLVFELYKSRLHFLQFISGHLIFLDSVDIGGCLIVALFERWIFRKGYFSNVFFWPVNCTCQASISYHILDVNNVSFEEF